MDIKGCQGRRLCCATVRRRAATPSICASVTVQRFARDMESSAEVLAEIRKMRADATEQQSRAGADTVSQEAAPDATIQPDSTAGALSSKLDAQQTDQAADELAPAVSQGTGTVGTGETPSDAGRLADSGTGGRGDVRGAKRRSGGTRRAEGTRPPRPGNMPTTWRQSSS